MGKQKKYADRRLPKGFASWEEFAAKGREKAAAKREEIKRLAEIGRKAEQEKKEKPLEP